jgi:GATA-binding protein, other eukaryote
MSTADYGERGGIAAPRPSSVQRLVSRNSSLSTAQQGLSSTPSATALPTSRDHTIADSKTQSSHAQQPFPLKPDSNNTGILDLPDPDDVARDELLCDTVFPTWRDDSGGDTIIESPEELQKKDPLGTQIWKLYSRTKTRLPNQERMENLTWRMMAMNLRRREQMQAAYGALSRPSNLMC